MPRTPRSPAAALVLILALALSGPAWGAESLSSARQKREAARQKRAQLAAKVNALRASDSQLTTAVSVLTKQVNAQQASANAARQAVQAALATVADAEARIAVTEKQVVTLRTAVVNRAVSAYVRPERSSFADIIGARDLAEASRRSSMVAQITNRDRDGLDQLRSLRQDLDEEQLRAAQARDVAAERRKAVLARLSELQVARMQKQRLSDALEARIREFQAEADEVARQESGLSALIRSKEREVVDPGGDGRVSGAGLTWPLRGPVTSGFGPRWGRLHAGIDISARSGTPIRAAKAGEVILAGSYGGYGNTVIINHGGGLATLYAHQSRVGTREGATVATGEVIGFVGSTGHSTGPHLHFETRVNGSPQNPRRYLP